MTNLLAVLHRMVGTKDVIAGLIAGNIRRSGIYTIVDLGSGSGGIMPEVVEILKSEYGIHHVRLLLTDLFPNQELIDKWGNEREPVRYYPEPVEATRFEKVPAGLKTMINCFHHMKPKEARIILEQAQKYNEPLLIYEMGENNIPLILWWILLPISLVILIIMALFMTPWVRPLGWRQLLFTYIIPVIPICYAWDGQASLPRMYTIKDLDQLLEGLQSSDYLWKKGKAYKKNKKQLGTYLMGIPNNN